MFWRKGCRQRSWWKNKLLHCALTTVHLVLEYNTIHFVFVKGFNIVWYSFYFGSNPEIFPKTSSADSSSVLGAVDFCSFSFINLDMPIITSISASLILDAFSFD